MSSSEDTLRFHTHLSDPVYQMLFVSLNLSQTIGHCQYAESFHCQSAKLTEYFVAQLDGIMEPLTDRKRKQKYSNQEEYLTMRCHQTEALHR